jgi:hypothetical protein
VCLHKDDLFLYDHAVQQDRCWASRCSSHRRLTRSTT